MRRRPHACVSCREGPGDGALSHRRRRQPELRRARLERLRGQLEFAQKRGREAPPLLLDAAKRFEPLDAAAARETYLDAFGAAIFAGRESSGGGVVQAAEAARAAPPGPRPPRPVDLLLDGLAKRFTAPYGEAVPALKGALHAFAEGNGGGDDELRWLWTACPVTPEPLAPELWDDETWHELASRAVSLAREATPLSAPSCSSAPERSGTTCTRSSASSTSPRATSSAAFHPPVSTWPRGGPGLRSG